MKKQTYYTHSSKESFFISSLFTFTCNLRRHVEGNDDSSSVVAKTVERVGSKVKSTRGLLKTGVSRLREKPLSTTASAVEYTKVGLYKLYQTAGLGFRV